MSIEDYSVEELKRELERKEQKEKLKAIPKLRDRNDLEKNVWKLAVAFHEWYTKPTAEGNEPHGSDHYTYEMLVDFLYGDGFWDWINSLNK